MRRSYRHLITFGGSLGVCGLAVAAWAFFSSSFSSLRVEQTPVTPALPAAVAPTPFEAAAAAGNAHWEAGRFEQAEAEYQAALEHQLDGALLARLGTLAKARGDVQQALRLYRQALDISPHLHDVANSVAWILATDADSRLRSPAEALRIAEQVCEETGHAHPRYLDTLSAAQAANGDFTAALATIDAAQALLAEPQLTDAEAMLRSAFAARRASYAAGRPFFDFADASAPNLYGLPRGDRQVLEQQIDAYLSALRPGDVASKLFARLARVLCTATDARARDGRLAERVAAALVDLDPTPQHRSTLAAAHAECGDFDRALAEVAVAIRGMTPAGQADLSDMLREQKTAYRAQLATREPTAQFAAIEDLRGNAFAYHRLAFACREVARRSVAEGQDDLAEMGWRQALHFDPQHRPTYIALARHLQARGRLGEAGVHFAQALLIRRDDADVLVELATLRKAQGRTRAAIQGYRDALELEPTRVDVANSLAWLLATAAEPSERRPAEALELARRLCHQTHEVDASCLDTFAVASAALGDFTEATAAIEKAIGLLTSERERVADALQQRAIEARLEGFQLRRELFHEQIAFVNARQAYVDLGDRYQQQGKYEVAARLYRQALALHHDDPETLVKFATLAKHFEQTELAQQLYGRALSLRDDLVDVANSLAWSYATHDDAAHRDGEKAILLAEHVCRLTGRNNPRYLDTLAAAYAEGRHFARAITTIDEALELLAAGHPHAEQPPQFQRQLELRRRLYSISNAYRNPLAARLVLAEYALQSGLADEAEGDLLAALQLNADHAAALTALATLYKSQGRIQAALAYYRRAYKTSPGRLDVGNSLAWLLTHAEPPALRDLPEAVRLAEAICQSTNRTQPHYLDTLAAAYAASGRFEEALQTVAEAIRHLPDDIPSDVRTAMLKRRDRYAAGQTSLLEPAELNP